MILIHQRAAPLQGTALLLYSYVNYLLSSGRLCGNCQRRIRISQPVLHAGSQLQSATPVFLVNSTLLTPERRVRCLFFPCLAILFRTMIFCADTARGAGIAALTLTLPPPFRTKMATKKMSRTRMKNSDASGRFMTLYQFDDRSLHNSLYQSLSPRFSAGLRRLPSTGLHRDRHSAAGCSRAS
jgi:hypothetical protein